MAIKKRCHFLIAVERKRGSIGSRVKHWQISLAIIAALSASLALADDFKTTAGKEYKNATVSRVEADGIVVKTKSGITKIYFTELPKEVQERFHYDPEKAAAAQSAEAQQTQEHNKRAAELDRQRKDAYSEQQRQWGEQQAQQQNAQALVDRLAELRQREENLLAEIGRIEKAATDARHIWYCSNYQNQPYTDPAEKTFRFCGGV